MSQQIVDFLESVHSEIERAEAKWPDNEIYHRLAALSGEVGELAEGVIKGESREALEREAIQVAACAYRAYRALGGIA